MELWAKAVAGSSTSSAQAAAKLVSAPRVERMGRTSEK
jgi:hypothetical protein